MSTQQGAAQSGHLCSRCIHRSQASERVSAARILNQPLQAQQQPGVGLSDTTPLFQRSSSVASARRSFQTRACVPRGLPDYMLSESCLTVACGVAGEVRAEHRARGPQRTCSSTSHLRPLGIRTCYSSWPERLPLSVDTLLVRSVSDRTNFRQAPGQYPGANLYGRLRCKERPPSSATTELG